jgi:hypothetical protein
MTRLLICLLLTGCASDGYIRVTEYSAGGIPGINAAAGGIKVTRKGTISGTVIYQSEDGRILYRSDGAEVEN